LRSVSFAEPTTDTRFMYELAGHLHKTVGELAVMDSCEFTGWKAYFSVLDHENSVKAAEGEGKSVWIRPPWEVRDRG
jgi:hypothetical protein